MRAGEGVFSCSLILLGTSTDPSWVTPSCSGQRAMGIASWPAQWERSLLPAGAKVGLQVAGRVIAVMDELPAWPGGMSLLCG